MTASFRSPDKKCELPRRTVSNRLLLGLGNDILTDDSVGLRVAAEIRARWADAPGLAILETSEMGLSLLDLITGYDELLLVDAVQTQNGIPGFVHELSGDDLQAGTPVSPHFLGVGEVLALGRKLGLAMPNRVRIFAIEVADPHTVGSGLTPRLSEQLPAIVERILSVLKTAKQPV